MIIIIITSFFIELVSIVSGSTGVAVFGYSGAVKLSICD